MPGKAIVVALTLTAALAVMWRMFGVSESHEGSQLRPAAERAAGLSRVEATSHGPTQTDKGSTSQWLHPDQAPVTQAKDQTSHHAETKAIEAEKNDGRKPSGGSDVAVAPGSESLDESVVGQSFPVSESILAACKESRRDRTCERGMSLLATFAQEPREDLWASSSERAIRALVELEPGTNRPRAITYTIRNLECRKKICFVEMASHMQRFSTQFFYFESSNSLNAGYAMDGTETKEDDTKMFVTLLPVIRR
jgi:hypothetical protein